VPGAVAVRRGVGGGDGVLRRAQAAPHAVPPGRGRDDHRDRCPGDAADGDAVPRGSGLPQPRHPVHAGRGSAGRARVHAERVRRRVRAGGALGEPAGRGDGRRLGRGPVPAPPLRRALPGPVRPGGLGPARARLRGRSMSARGRFAPGQVLFGGDWSPEQWDPATWDEDLELMRRARVNTVTLGVFSWSSLEPTEGAFVTDWLDEILERLAAAGIGFFLATPTASPPPWFTRAYPDALPVRADGTRLTHGSRDTYAISAPAYREAARRITRRLA